MPLLTRAAAALTRSSVTLQAKRFQLFQPMGGVKRQAVFQGARGRNAKNNSEEEEQRQTTCFFHQGVHENASAYVSFRTQR